MESLPPLELLAIQASCIIDKEPSQNWLIIVNLILAPEMEGFLIYN